MKSYLLIVGISGLFQLILPLGIGLWFAISSGINSKLEWIIARLALMTYTVFFVLVGAGWHIYGIYTRWILLAITMVFCLPGARAVLKEPSLPNLTFAAWTSWLKLFVQTLLVVFFGLQSFQILNISPPKKEPIRLTNPLQNGNYLVVQGGPAGLNHHASVKAQQHALDIVKLNIIGTRASGLLPDNSSAYEIFGETLYAPCSGTILHASDELQDQPPPKRNLEHVPGNYISLNCNEHTVVLAHLKHESLAVTEGENVETGNRLAKVGNTGNSTEPHLHIHAVTGKAGGKKELFSERAGVPIKFRGHSYPLVRNSTFTIQEN